MKVIIIAYEFPPLNVGGTARAFRFANYLPNYDIKPVVFTLHPASYLEVFENPKTDAAKLNQLDTRVELIQVKSENIISKKVNKIRNFLQTYFNFHKGVEAKYWKKNLNIEIDKYLVNNSADCIYVTAPPFSVLTLAKRIANKHKLPLVVDFRDPMTLWTINPYGNYLTYLLTKLTERNILKSASAIIATSKVTIEDMQTLHPKISKNKFHYIPNSFEGTIQYKTITTKVNNKITIGYVGSFYYSPESRRLIFTPWYKKRGHRILQFIPRKEDWLYRSPFFVFKAISELITKNPEYKNKVILRFAGKKEAWFDEMVKKLKLGEIVEHVGWLSHAESIEFQNNCDWLLLTSAKVINGSDYSIAGKTFEYIKLQKPILGFVCNGAQKDLLESTGIAKTFNPDEIESNSEMLLKLFSEKIYLTPNEEFISSFTSENQTKRLASILTKFRPSN